MLMSLSARHLAHAHAVKEEKKEEEERFDDDDDIPHICHFFT